MSSITQCEPRNRCRQWRVCPTCSNIRQAQIANVAESGANTSSTATFAVIRSFNQDTFGRDKQGFMNRITRKTQGGIWTIETGNSINGLHMNLIIGTDNAVDAGMLAQAWKQESDIYAEEIPKADVRKVAAYIAKKKGYPDKTDYAGRLYGSWGTWKQPLRILAGSESGYINPALKAMGLEQQLIDLNVPEPMQIADQERPHLIQPPKVKSFRETKETARERIAINEAEIDRVNRINQIAKNEAVRDAGIKRVLAIARNEIEVKGFAYIKGYGLMNKADLMRYGFEDVSTD